MKHIIIFLVIFALPSIGFSKKVLPEACFPSTQELRDATKALKKAENKYKAICRRDHNSKILDRRTKKSIQYKEQFSEYNQWIKTCNESRIYEVLKNTEELKKIRDKIKDIKKNTMIGRIWSRRNTVSNEIYRVFRTDPDYPGIYARWSEATSALKKREIELITAHLRDDGPCGKDSADPKVYNAYLKYKEAQKKCNKLEEDYLSALNKHTELYTKYNEYESSFRSNENIKQPILKPGSVK